MTPMDKGAIDTVCIYCPETDECYYVRPDAHGTSVTLRIARRELCAAPGARSGRPDASVTATATKGTSRYRAAD